MCNGWDLANLPVVLLTVDAAAFTIQVVVDSSTFAWADIAIGPSVSLIYPGPCEPCLEPAGFAPSQLAAPYALIDPLLLIVLASIDSARTRHRHCACAKNNHDGK